MICNKGDINNKHFSDSSDLTLVTHQNLLAKNPERRLSHPKPGRESFERLGSETSDDLLSLKLEHPDVFGLSAVFSYIFIVLL